VKPRTRFLKRFVLAPDAHPFVGRIYDLSIVAYHFDSYEELSRYADCKYAIDVNQELTTLMERIESLNMAGRLFWPAPIPDDFSNFPVSRYEWLTIAADVFLMRYISVFDCLLLVTNEVFEVGLDRRKCSIENLKKRKVSEKIISILKEILADQGGLRDERNMRFHHGIERWFTADDSTFRTAALYEHRGRELRGTDRHGRRINVERSFKEGLVALQREFNQVTRRLLKQLNRLFDELSSEFESKFSPRFRAGPFSYVATPRVDPS
jgi:hypothetical protein